MKLTYLPIRGRAEPILLLLIDSGIEFDQEVITLKEWNRLRSEGKIEPVRFPFSALPTLTYSHGARGGVDTVLAESGAILTYLEGKFKAPGSAPMAPDIASRLEMIREASSFLLNHLINLSSSPDWLSPPHRNHLLTSFITPYLDSLSHHLSSSFYPPLLFPPLEEGVPGTSLTAAAAAVYTTLSFISDLFPKSIGFGHYSGLDSHWPRCEELRKEIEERERIKEWLKSGKRETCWTSKEFGSREFIEIMAEKWDSVDALLQKVELEETLEEVESETGAE